MKELIVKFAFIGLFMLIAAWNISSCIVEYIDGKYFVGSIDAMLALWMILNVLKVFFDW